MSLLRSLNPDDVGKKNMRLINTFLLGGGAGWLVTDKFFRMAF